MNDEWKLIDTLARELEIKNINGKIAHWRWHGRVPHKWRLPIIQAAAKRGVFLDQAVFDRRPADYRKRAPRRRSEGAA